MKDPVPQRELFTNGKLSAEGMLQGGKRHGVWTFYYVNGRMKAAGAFLNGELHGDWRWWRANGQSLQEGTFERGVQVGLWRRYYDNGQLWDEGVYNPNGKKTGEWKVYDRDGKLKKMIQYPAIP